MSESGNPRFITAAEVAANYAPIGSGGGSFLSANIARVDASGNDATGAIGDLTKPFLTVQAALNAFSPGVNNAVIDIGNNFFQEDLVLDFDFNGLAFIGSCVGLNFSRAFRSLTTTHSLGSLFLMNILAGSINFAGGQIFQLGGTCFNITADGGLWLESFGGGLFEGSIITSTTGRVDVINVANPAENGITVNAGTNVGLWNSIVDHLTCVGNLELYDGRVLNSPSVGGSIVYHDTFLNPKAMNFATLPTSDPGVSGLAWVDPGSSFVIKVSQG